MIDAIVTMGFSISDAYSRADDYVPAMDGYRPQARQHCYRGFVPDLGTIAADDVTQVAEALFMLTNHPDGVEADLTASGARLTLPAAAVEALRVYVRGAYRDAGGRDGYVRALSVGDTVSLRQGFTSATVACERVGWTPVRF